MATRRLGLVIIDRDGVINVDSDEYIKSPDEWVPMPGSLAALAALTRAGATLVVATNQSGIGRGLFSEATLGRIHAKMNAAVAAAGGRIAGIYHCPHRPDEGCRCRKPAPALLERIGADFGESLAGIPFIGDKVSDIEAALAVGARPILVGDRVPAADREAAARGIERYPDLPAAARALIREADD